MYPATNPPADPGQRKTNRSRSPWSVLMKGSRAGRPAFSANFSITVSSTPDQEAARPGGDAGPVRRSAGTDQDQQRVLHAAPPAAAVRRSSGLRLRTNLSAPAQRNPSTIPRGSCVGTKARRISESIVENDPVAVEGGGEFDRGHGVGGPVGEESRQESRHDPGEPQAAADRVNPVADVGPGHPHRDDVRPEGREPPVGEEERLEGERDARDDDGEPRADQDRGEPRPGGMGAGPGGGDGDGHAGDEKDRRPDEADEAA